MSYTMLDLFKFFLSIYKNDDGSYLATRAIDDYAKKLKSINDSSLKDGKINKPLYNMSEAEVQATIRDLVYSDTDFIINDIKNKRAYSKALKKYYEFVCDLKRILAMTLRTTLPYESFKSYAKNNKRLTSININGEEANNIINKYVAYLENDRCISTNILKSDIADLIEIFKGLIAKKEGIDEITNEALEATLEAYLDYLKDILICNVPLLSFSEYLSIDDDNDANEIRGELAELKLLDLIEASLASLEKRIDAIRKLKENPDFNDKYDGTAIKAYLDKGLRYSYVYFVAGEILSSYKAGKLKYNKEYFSEIIMSLPPYLVINRWEIID